MVTNLFKYRFGLTTAFSLQAHAVLFILLLLLSVVNTAHAGALNASVDRSQLSSGETLELRIKYDGQTTGEPDLSLLKQDFEVLSSSQQNQFSFINGQSISITEWRIQLLPKKLGQLTIPRLEFKGEATNEINIQVLDQPVNDIKNQPVFIETIVDKSSSYVQEQILLTLRILATTSLQGISAEDLLISNAAITKVAEAQFQKQINGVNHLVIEQKYAIFPNMSGTLTIPPIRFSITLRDQRDPFSGSLFSRGGKRLFLFSEEKTLEIKPKPTTYGAGDWLPSNNVSLSEHWSRPLGQLVAGEPVTRTIYLKAASLTSAQLPPLDLKNENGIKVYPDQPQLDDEVSNVGVAATRTESFAIVPTRSGEVTLPAITVKWWDTKTSEVKETRLDPVTLHIQPAASISPKVSQPSQPVQDSSSETINSLTIPETLAPHSESTPLVIWILVISNILLAIIVITFWLLWYKARNQADYSSLQTLDEKKYKNKEAELFKQLERRIKDSDHQAVRETVIRWASEFWQQSLTTLDDVALLSGESELAAQLSSLDKMLYQANSTENIDLNNLLNLLRGLRSQLVSKKIDKKNHLKPLYNKT